MRLKAGSTFVQEMELMENLFNSLCSLLLEKDNRDRFLQGEGIQLMNLMLRYCHLICS
jgi:beta-catenin-like protein 1